MEKQTHSKQALVLGGGVQVGRAWLSGLASKLIEDGVQLQTADFILGTSAGAFVGAEIALQTLDLENPPPAVYVDSQSSATGAFALMAQVVNSSMPERVLQKIGQLALETQTMSEDQALQRVRSLAGQPWPKNFKATAVNVMSDERVLWDQDLVTNECYFMEPWLRHGWYRTGGPATATPSRTVGRCHPIIRIWETPRITTFCR